MNDQLDLSASDIIDLSRTGTRKLEKCVVGSAKALILDSNELTRLENLDSYGNLVKLSVADNKLVRMYGVCRVTNLQILNLANNCIVAIEGLRELVHLKWLKLAGNKIKNIEHLNSNVALEFLDLSNNCISSLVSLSHLKLLRTFLIENNNIKSLNYVGAYLPETIHAIGIANNLIGDLNQVMFLSNFKHLQLLTIANNPCVVMTGNTVGFDYRPFLINWCQNLKLLDGFVIGSKESLKAEWLYSMGKGRHFQIGEHAELVEYLANVCPMTTAEDLMTEEDAKLNLILSKWHQHQQQLRAEKVTELACDQRPMTAPTVSSRDASLVQSSARERTKPGSSSRPRSTALPLNSQRYFKEVSPTRNWRADTKRRNSDVLADKYPLELTFANFEAGTRERRLEDHDLEDDSEESYMSLSQEFPSDVPETSHDFTLDSEAPASTVPLRTETKYVPVPETMLSPDFRPVSASPQCPLLDVGIGSDAQIMSTSLEACPRWQQRSSSDAQIMSTSLEARPRWQQRSSIPRSQTLGPPSHSPKHLSDGRSSRAIHSSVTDSPLLKRPTQLQRLQKTSRPVSLSPSCRRRSPPVIKKGTNHGHDSSSSSNDDSTDSDVSLSKLALVKEAAQSKLDAIVRKTLHTSDGTRSSEGKQVVVSKVNVSEAKQGSKDGMNGHKAVNGDVLRAVTIIQAAWRGYRTRNYNRKSVEARHEIRVRRAEDHVRVLQDQLAKTRQELERERRLRTLQMEAIHALWNEVQQLQISYPHRSTNDSVIPGPGSESAIPSHGDASTTDPKLDGQIESSIAEADSGMQTSNSTSSADNFKESISSRCSNAENHPRSHADPGKADPRQSKSSSTWNSTNRKRDSFACITTDAGAKKMISHLIHSCSELQNQVKQLQEALGICPDSLHDPETHCCNILPDSLVHLPHSSSPFVSAVGTPESLESGVELPHATSPSQDDVVSLTVETAEPTVQSSMTESLQTLPSQDRGTASNLQCDGEADADRMEDSCTSHTSEKRDGSKKRHKSV